MLQQIRDKITGWFAGVFLGLIAIVFIFWGIQFEGAGNTAAATVNGEGIPIPMVRRAWQERQTELQRSTRDELSPEVIKTEQDRLLDQFIRRELLAQHAGELGYRISDQALAEALTQIPALQVDGQFSRDRYAALLRQQGRSEAEFENEFRNDLELTQLRNGMLVSSFVTPGELARRVALEGEKREIRLMTLPADRFAAAAKVSPEAIGAYYEQHKSEFMSEETVALQYIELNLADVAAEVEVSEEGLRQYYDEIAAERFVAPERRRASHILLESGEDDASARAEAEKLLAEIQGGADFATVARANSDDPGSREQGGDLGWSTRESFVTPFADALFGIETAGEIVGPVKTQFGYHIIRLDEVEAAHQRSFDEVREELEQEFRNDRAQALFYEKSQAIADDAFAALTEIDSVAQKHGLSVQTIERFTRNGGAPLGADRKLVDAAFSRDVLEERQNSPALSIGDDKVVVLRVTDHRLPEQQPLEQVSDRIDALLRADVAREAGEAEARRLAERLKNGEEIEAVATSAQAELVGEALTVDRAGGIPPELSSAVFALPAPAAGSPAAGHAVLATGDVAVFLLRSVTPGSVDSPEVAPTLRERARQSSSIAAASEFDAYIGELERSAEIKKNPQLWE
jgi:peptidyl-prolyl cis-trans isomerase D